MTEQPLLTFVHISDTHLHPDPLYKGDYAAFSARRGVEAMIAHINALPFPIDFVLHTGDVLDNPFRAEDYALPRAVLGKITAPLYYLVGNHDRGADFQVGLLGREQSEVTPTYDYTFEVNGVQIICLDSSVPGTHAGTLNEDQLAWLDRLCTAPDDRPLVVALHHHPLPLGSTLDDIILTNGEALHAILCKARSRLRVVLYGHIHEGVVTVRDGITYHSALSSWFQTRTWHTQQQILNDPSQTPGFNVVTLTATSTFVRAYRFPV